MSSTSQLCTRSSLSGLLLSGALCFGCSGGVGTGGSQNGAQIGSGDPSAPGAAGTGAANFPGATPGGAGNGAVGVGDPGSGGAGAETALPVPSLRSLTREQYLSSASAVVGSAVSGGFQLKSDIPLSGLRSIGAANLGFSERDTEQYQAAAESIAFEALSRPDAATWVGCDAAQDACAQQFLARVGQVAWRRPLSEVELARSVSIYVTARDKLGSGMTGLQWALAGLLQSPNFLYRVELGSGAAAAPGAVALGEYELASRLSYLLWNEPPDSALLAAAEAGTLSTTLTEHVSRLLLAPRLQTSLEDFFDDYLSLDRVPAVQKLQDAYPDYSADLGADFRTQTRLTLASAAASGQDFRGALSSRATFVNARLAAFYGIDGDFGDTFAEASFPTTVPRVGLLGHGSVLALHAHASSSSPTLRGKFVREALLCQGVPAPPQNVDTSLPDTSEAVTTRERLSLHSSAAACAGCHQLMDPIGLALENFDGIGAFRETERDLPIDVSGNLDGTDFSGPEGLANALAAHPRLADCMTRTLFRYAHGRLEAPSDAAALSELTTAFTAANYDFEQLLSALALHPSFQTVGTVD